MLRGISTEKNLVGLPWVRFSNFRKCKAYNRENYEKLTDTLYYFLSCMFFLKKWEGLFPKSGLSFSPKKNYKKTTNFYEEKKTLRCTRIDPKSMRKFCWYFVFSMGNNYTQEVDTSNTEKENRRCWWFNESMLRHITLKVAGPWSKCLLVSTGQWT